MQFQKMNANVKAKWLEALRSGDYKQGRGSLLHKDGTYCCLGVLCAVAVKEGITQLQIGEYSNGFGEQAAYRTAFPPQDVNIWAGLDHGAERHLAEINDRSDDFGPTIEAIEREL